MGVKTNRGYVVSGGTVTNISHMRKHLCKLLIASHFHKHSDIILYHICPSARSTTPGGYRH